MKFGRSTCKAQANADRVDAAYAAAEASIVDFGKAVADRIATEFRAGRTDDDGVSAGINLALEQAAGSGVAGVPAFALKQLLTTLHLTIVVELTAAGLPTGDPINEEQS